MPYRPPYKSSTDLIGSLQELQSSAETTLSLSGGMTKRIAIFLIDRLFSSRKRQSSLDTADFLQFSGSRMAFVFKDYLFERLTSRTFTLPFAFVTLLLVVDVATLTFFMPMFPNLKSIPAFSYGAILTTYVLCVVEALGMSVFSRALKRIIR
jgi:hypothetical protein